MFLRFVSKHMGETEKNLCPIFQGRGCSRDVSFAEAYSLSGSRLSSKDAQERYDNIESAYLFQKGEEREGVRIVATNLRANMDQVFLRLRWSDHAASRAEDDRRADIGVVEKLDGRVSRARSERRRNGVRSAGYRRCQCEHGWLRR